MKQYLIKFFYLSFLSTAIIIGAKSFDSKKLLSFLEAKIQNENKNTEINQNNASLALEEKSNNGTSVPFHNFKVTDTNYSEKKRKNQKQITINTRSSRDETSKNNSPKRINSNSLEREGIQDNKRYVASENERSKSTQDEKNNNKDNKLLVDDSTNNGNTDISTQEDATQYSDQTDQSSPDATNFEQGNNGIAINQNSQTQPNTNNTNAATTPATTANSPVNNSSSQPLTPKLKGIVYPLKNLSITYENKKLRIPELLLRSSFASSCSAIASIHEIDHATATPELIPITSSAIKPDATFDLSIDENVIDTENPSKYVLKINGCSSSYSRIITSFFTEQDVSIGTTLLMKVIEVSTPKKITEADIVRLAQISQTIDHNSNTFEDAYNQLSNNPSSSNDFQIAFGTDISVLTTTKPTIMNENVSVIVNEQTNNPFSLDSQHWYSHYNIVQEWYLDTQFQMTGQNYTFSPNANNQGSHAIKTIIGRSDGNGHVDLTLPYEEKIWNITVLDSVPALAPLFSLHTSNPSPILINTLDLDIQTGVNFTNCESFSKFVITETPMVPPSNLFSLECQTQGNQIENYSLTNLVDGAKTLYLWTRDSSGQISASPRTLNYRKDTTNPTANLTNILGILQGGSVKTLIFSAFDDNEITNINLAYSTDGGITYSSIVNLPSGSTSYNWSVPLSNSSTVNVKLTATDGAGKLALATSSSFSIDSTAPAAPTVALASPAITNSTAATLTVNNCLDTDDILLNNGAIPLSSDLAWSSCNTSVGNYSYTLSPIEGTQNFAVWGKDSSGNISASTTISVIYDITAPTTTIGNLPALVKGGDTYGLTFSKSDLNGVLSSSLSYTTDGTNYVLIANNPSSPHNWTIPSTDTSNLKLRYIVTDNAGNIETKTSAVSTIDSTPPTPHTISIASALVTNSVNILLTTSSCTDTSGILINEGTQPLESDPNWQACQTTPGAITFSILATEGTHTLKAWFKDSAGNVSTLYTTANLIFDVTNPTQSLNNISALVRGNDTINITFSQSDLNGISSSKLQYSQDGITFSDITSNPTSPYAWSVPLHDTLNAKVRLISIDSATNVATATTSTFTIDSSEPTSPNITRTSANITNTTVITFTANSCVDTPYLFFNEGSQPNRNDVGWITCTTVANAHNYTINTTEGSHSIKIWSKDTAGNISSVPTLSAVTYDITAPTNSLTDLASLLKGGSVANIIFSESDLNGLQANKIQYASDGITFIDIANSALSPYAWTIPTHNTSNAKIKIISTDNAGNASIKISSIFIVDSTVPSISLTNLPSNIRGGASQNITFSQTDANGIASSKLQYSSDGITFSDIITNPTSPYSWTVPTVNTASAKIRLISTDSAGNTTNTDTSVFNIDSTPPSAPLISLSSPVIRNIVANTFTASSCTDTPFILFNESTQPNYNDANWIACTTVVSALGFNMTAIESAHTIKAWAKDAVGNVSSLSTNFTVTYDITPPTNVLNNLAALIKGGTSQAVSFTQSDLNGIQSHKLQYSSDGSTFNDVVTNPISPYTWSSPLHNTATAYIRLITTDNAGNISTKTTSAFTIDSTPPSAPVAALYSALISSSTNVAITVTDCLDRPSIFISESIIAPGSGDAGWNTCNTTAGGLSYILPGPVAQGLKTIYIYAKDAAGNVSASNSFNMTYDTISPSVTLTTAMSGVYKGGTNINLNFSASDTNGLNVFRLEYASDGVTFTTVANFTAGTTNYNWTIPTDNTVNAKIRIVSHDNAIVANTNMATSATFSIDSTAPSEAVATLHSAYYSTSTTVALTISSCADRPYIFTNEGTQPLSTDAGWVACATTAGAISFTIPATQGVHNLKVWAKDAVGNVTATAPTITMVYDTVLPVINITTTNNVRGNQVASMSFAVTEANISSAQNYLIEYHNGSAWSNWNIQAHNGPLSSYAYSTNITTPNSENTLLTFRVSYTDLAGNYRQSSVQFRTDLLPPTLNSLSLNSGAISTTNNNIQIALSASDNLSRVTQFCLKYNDTTAPTTSSSCWIDVNAPSPGITPAVSISFTGYYYQIGFAKGSYTVYGWVKDESGQISTNAASLNVDMASISFDPGTVPVISKAIATNTDAPGDPIDASDLVAPNGSDIYIKWNASDIEGLAANPINIQYTTNDTAFTDLPGGQNLANGQNGSCTIDGTLTGCVKLQAPSSTYFKLRIIAKDTLGTTVFFNTVPLNEGKLKILAGNTEHGLNGSARSAVFYTYNAYQSNGYGAKYKLVVSDDGKFFYLDPQRGLLWVEPSTGALKSFISTTGTSSGDNGPVSSATLRSPGAITLDHYNNLIIWDYNIIRKIDLDTMTITKLVGGGATANPGTTILATDFQLPTGFNQTWGSLIPLPNGDLIFSNTGTTLHYRYRALDQKVERIEIQGTGVYGYPADSWGSLGKTDLAIAYNTTNSQIQFMIQGLYKSFTGDSFAIPAVVDYTSGDENTPYNANGPHNTAWNYRNYNVALNGKIYLHTRYRSEFHIYDHTNNTTTRILGTGSESASPCADDTIATSCAVGLDSVFISKTGRLYFIDNGLLRTVDDSNKVITLFGQFPSYGDGVLATAARFGNIIDINLGKTLPSNNKVIVQDGYANLFREITFDNNIQNLTGACYSWSGPHSFEVDSSDGDILSSCGTAFRRYDRDTSAWSNVIGGGATNYYTAAAIGKTGAEINLVSGYNTNTNGIINGKLLYQKYYWSAGVHYGCSIRSYDINDSYRVGDFMSNTNADCVGGINTGVNMTSHPVAETNFGKFRLFTDPSDAQNKYFFSTIGNNKIYKSQNLGIIDEFVTLAHSMNSFTQAVQADGLNLYYCATNGYLYKYNYNSGITSNLPWNSPTIKCKATRNIIHHPTRNTLILVISQNGLNGVAEYDLN